MGIEPSVEIADEGFLVAWYDIAVALHFELGETQRGSVNQPNRSESHAVYIGEDVHIALRSGAGLLGLYLVTDDLTLEPVPHDSDDFRLVAEYFEESD